jgi:NAD(P)H-quinone oxidoreductase subunit 5
MNYFHVDAISIIMISLIWFIFISIVAFSKNYLSGDRKQTQFYINLTALVVSSSVLVSANHLIIFFTSWCCSNLFLTLLMGHKLKWKAAKHSALLAAKNFLIGSSAIGAAFFLLYKTTGSLFIEQIIQTQAHSLPLFLLLVGAMTQSALLPFHNWLLSSLNSPTPVSAIMHAGLINGGGFLLIRFAPLFIQHPTMLTAIFVLGMITAIIGGFFQLIQTDIKRLLACSTMGQMGFMVVQCGLGLFPAAAAHLFWHGLFKAYLFLASGSAAQRKRIQYCAPTAFEFIFALACGILGSWVFTQINHIDFLTTDSNAVLIVLLIMTGIQSSLPLVKKNKISAVLGALSVGIAYGYSVLIIETILMPMNLQHPQPLTVIHCIGMLLLVLGWLFVLFEKYKTNAPWMLRLYMFMVNKSQPNKKTITAHRNQYQC